MFHFRISKTPGGDVRTLVRPAVSLIVALVLVGCATQSSVPSQQENAQEATKRKFIICDAEGSSSLLLARVYFLSGKKRESVGTYLKTDADRQRADDLFHRVATGEVKHYADFAVERLYACAAREGFSINKSRALARVCYARVDIPFFLFVFKSQGMTKAAAVKKVRSMLDNQQVYPEKLVYAVADQVYPSATFASADKLMGATFWSCLYSQ